MLRGLILCAIASVLLYPADVIAAGAERNKDLREANVKGYSFEAGIPAEISVDRGGKIAISSKHSKHGSSSLEWSWKNRSILTFSDVKAAEGRKINALRIWIYNEMPADSHLIFRLGNTEDLKTGRAVYEFKFGLNYRGWRAFWIQLNKDLVPLYKTGKNISAMKVFSPPRISSGKVFFDIVDFVERVDGKRSRDVQVPFVNKNSDSFWQQTYRWSLSRPGKVVPKEVTEKQKKDFETIYQRYCDWFLGKDVDFSEPAAKLRKAQLDKYISAGVKAIEKYKMERDGDTVRGIGLFASISPYGAKFSRHVIAESMLQLLFDYEFNGSQSSKNKLLDVFDYLNDQGWACGSANGSLDHELNRSSSYMHTVVLFRDELAKAGKLRRELATMGWYAEKGEIYNEKNAGITADRVISHILFRLLNILAAPDGPEKLRDMQCFTSWVNRSLSIAPGWTGLIKPDYLAFHHKAHYGSAYGTPALQSASLIIYLLHGTEFALSREVTENVKQAILTVRDFSNLYDMPIGVMGRFPFKEHVLASYIPMYAYMALAAEPVDTEMVAAFKRLWRPQSDIVKQSLIAKLIDRSAYFQTMGSLQLMQQAAKLEVAPESSPAGHMSKNYGALAIHRRDNWMVSLKGTSKYVWDYEAHDEKNRMQNIYGRYLSYGTMQIIGSGSPVNSRQSGYLEDGWDWNLWPGATTIYLPLEKLIGKKARNFTDKPFVGGLTHKKNNGIFVFDFHDTTFNTSFTAQKSYFFFDDLIVCLGSGIGNDDTVNPTRTTLFQGALTDKTAPIMVNCPTPAEVIPFSKTFKAESNRPIWLMDAFDNGYYVRSGQDVVVSRSQQRSRDNTDKKQTSGNFATAWIGHGKSPKNAGYEYAVKVKSRADVMADFVLKPEYEVLRRDNKAHVVRSLKLSLTGYAIFDSSARFSDGIVVSVSDPAMVMSYQSDNDLVISFCDPDLRLIDQPLSSSQKVGYDILFNKSKPKSVKVKLRGRWQLRAKSDVVKNIDIKDDITAISVECKDGASYEIALKKWRVRS